MRFTVEVRIEVEAASKEDAKDVAQKGIDALDWIIDGYVRHVKEGRMFGG